MSFSIHPEGWRFAGIFLSISLILWWVSPALGLSGFILTGWCLYFFRNPPRVTPQRKHVMVSPADGIIVAIADVIPPTELEMATKKHTRISIFLNVFDVHLNRVPFDGKVKKRIYHAGKFFNASLDKASEHNERSSLVISTQHPSGDYAVTQIAGLIARRIRCDVQEGDQLETGHLYGLIRFGSRVDLYLPHGVKSLVEKGQRMIGGETVVADFKD